MSSVPNAAASTRRGQRRSASTHPQPRPILPDRGQSRPAAFQVHGQGAIACDWECRAQQGTAALKSSLPRERWSGLMRVPPVLCRHVWQVNRRAASGCSGSDGASACRSETFLESLGRAATRARTLQDGSRLLPRGGRGCAPRGEDLLVQQAGRIAALVVTDATVPLMGKTAQGACVMRLVAGETIVGAASVSADGDRALAAGRPESSACKVKSLRLCERGDLRPDRPALRFERRDRMLLVSCRPPRGRWWRP